MYTTSHQPMRIRRTVTVDGHTIRYQPTARTNDRRPAISGSRAAPDGDARAGRQEGRSEPVDGEAAQATIRHAISRNNRQRPGA